MNTIVAKILPVILVFFLGFLMKKRGVLNRDDADSLLKIFFHVSVPALIFISVQRMKFTPELLWLPVIPALVVFANYFVARFGGKLLKLDDPSLGAFVVGTLIMNTGFIFPFLLAVRGEEGLAQGALFDLGHTAVLFSFVYLVACRYGGNSDSRSALTAKLLSSPPLWALVLAVALNLARVRLPDVITQFLGTIGYMSMPIVMLTLGIYFTPKPYKIVPVCSAVFIRTILGLLLGFLFVSLFDLKGLTRTVVLVCCSAPSGVTTLVFSSVESLDNEFAASVVSYSLLVGLFLIPVLLQFCS